MEGDAVTGLMNSSRFFPFRRKLSRCTDPVLRNMSCSAGVRTRTVREPTPGLEMVQLGDVQLPAVEQFGSKGLSFDEGRFEKVLNFRVEAVKMVEWILAGQTSDSSKMGEEVDNKEASHGVHPFHVLIELLEHPLDRVVGLARDLERPEMTILTMT